MICRDLFATFGLPRRDKNCLVVRQGDIDPLDIFIAQIEAINILM